eukprot:363469-Chlamydomonas_euryale.AAC.10
MTWPPSVTGDPRQPRPRLVGIRQACASKAQPAHQPSVHRGRRYAHHADQRVPCAPRAEAGHVGQDGGAQGGGLWGKCVCGGGHPGWPAV